MGSLSEMFQQHPWAIRDAMTETYFLGWHARDEVRISSCRPGQTYWTPCSIGSCRFDTYDEAFMEVQLILQLNPGRGFVLEVEPAKTTEDYR
jgi:hypothetical protein